MTIEEVRKYAEENDLGIVYFTNPNFNESIIGISIDDRVIYDYDSMVNELMKTDNISCEEAIDFIEYNTIRALPYIDNAPIILRYK